MSERDDRKDVCVCGYKREHHSVEEMWPCHVNGCACEDFAEPRLVAESVREFERLAGEHPEIRSSFIEMAAKQRRRFMRIV